MVVEAAARKAEEGKVEGNKKSEREIGRASTVRRGAVWCSTICARIGFETGPTFSRRVVTQVSTRAVVVAVLFLSRGCYM